MHSLTGKEGKAITGLRAALPVLLAETPAVADTREKFDVP